MKMRSNINNVQEDKMLENSEKVSIFSGEFSLSALVFCGLYYCWCGCYLAGGFFVFLCIAVPLKLYFLVGLLAAFLLGRVRRKGSRGVRDVCITGLMLLLFVARKYVRYCIMGGI